MHAVANAVHCQGRLLRCRIDPRGRPKSHQGGLSRGPVGPQGSPSWPASSHRSSVAAIPARRCVPTSACTCRMRCWGAPSSAWMPPPGGRGVRGGCPVHLRWLGRASKRACVGQTIVDSPAYPPYHGTRRGRCLFVCCTHSPELCATLYLPILCTIRTKGSRIREALPKQYRISAPAGARAGVGPARARPVWPKECPDPGSPGGCSRGYLGRKGGRLT